MDEGTSRGRVAALLALVVRALEAVNAGIDPRQQICTDLSALWGSDTSVYVTCGPSGAQVLCSSGFVDPGLVERAIWLLPADARPFQVTEPHRACSGFCVPLTVSSELTTALVLSGGTPDSALLAEAGRALREVDALIAGLPDAATAQRPPGWSGVPLTPREHEVLELLGDGLLARTIAGRLDLSPRTVHHHLGRIYEKLGVGDRLAAVLRAREQGLLSDRPRRVRGSLRQLAGASPDPWS